MDDHGQGSCPNLASRYDWQETVRRVRFGPRSKTREIALLLSLYGDKDGTSYYPGVARLAAVAECSERTVRDALDTLRTLGLLERVAEGSQHGRPRAGTKPRKDEHHLTIPPDLADRVDMLPADELDPQREERRRSERRADNDRRRQKRHAAAAVLAASPSGKGSVEDSRGFVEGSVKGAYQGKVGAPYQGKVDGVTGETSDRNRGKLQPDIRDATSGNAPYPLIRPSDVPTHRDDPSDPMDPPVARAPGAEDHDHQDNARDRHESNLGALAVVLGELTEAEELLARQMLDRGERMTTVHAELAKRRPPPQRRASRSRWTAA